MSKSHRWERMDGGDSVLRFGWLLRAGWSMPRTDYAGNHVRSAGGQRALLGGFTAVTPQFTAPHLCGNRCEEPWLYMSVSVASERVTSC